MNNELIQTNNTLKYFLAMIIAVCVIGIIMVYSSSFIYAKEVHNSSSYFFIRQLCFLGLSAGLAYIVGRTKYSFWPKYGPYVNLFFSILILLTFIPGIGINVKGANRWLAIGGFTLQPGEFVKYTLLVTSAYYFENFYKLQLKQKINFGICLVLPLILLVLQPDFGSFTICFILIAFVCFLSSFPRKYFYSIFVFGLLVGIPILLSRPYRVRRLLAFLDPWKNSQSSGFQVIQSYLAFANGSVTGLGLGNSNEKLFYLPEAHNDFIFSVIGEELGFIGILIVVSLFVGILYLGMKLALNVKNKIGFLLVASVVFTITIQAALNMGVVLGLLPTKGLNLPFISYGGSSLMANFFGIGLILSVLKHESSMTGRFDQNL